MPDCGLPSSLQQTPAWRVMSVNRPLPSFLYSVLIVASLAT